MQSAKQDVVQQLWPNSPVETLGTWLERWKIPADGLDKQMLEQTQVVVTGHPPVTLDWKSEGKPTMHDLLLAVIKRALSSPYPSVLAAGYQWVSSG